MEYLARKNVHPRDDKLAFYPDTHIYSILAAKEVKMTSTTTFVSKLFPKFDALAKSRDIVNGKKARDPKSEYYQKTDSEIRDMWTASGSKAAAMGTDLHERIERMMNVSAISNNKDLLEFLSDNDDPSATDTIEWSYFLRFLAEYPYLKPYRTEWRIFDEAYGIAGSVDMIFFDPESNTFDIYDWKRTKDFLYESPEEPLLDALVAHIPNSTFHKYSLQLNVYKFILENKYDFPIGKMRLVRLHPLTESKSYELYECPDYQREVGLLLQKMKWLWK